MKNLTNNNLLIKIIMNKFKRVNFIKMNKKKSKLMILRDRIHMKV